MKRIIKTVALLSVLGMATVSCQKETINDSIGISNVETNQYTLVYSIDGIFAQVSFSGEEEMGSFIESLVALAEEGHRVSFRKATTTHEAATKDVLTFTTKDHDAAVAWGKERVAEGYEVIIVQDDSGIYICTAIK